MAVSLWQRVSERAQLSNSLNKIISCIIYCHLGQFKCLFSVCLCVCVCVYRLLLPTLITSVLMMLTDYITLFFSCHGLKIYGAWLNKYHITDLWLFRILVKLYIQSSEKPRAALLLPLELRGLSGSQVLLMKCIWLILIDHHFWLFVCLKAFRCVLMPKGQRKNPKTRATTQKLQASVSMFIYCSNSWQPLLNSPAQVQTSSCLKCCDETWRELCTNTYKPQLTETTL